MSGLLTTIAEEKLVLVAQLLANSPPVRPDARGAVRGLVSAIRGGGVIAEIKRCSPSVLEFPNGSDPLAQARIYAENGASAISIVTDTPRFGMTLDDVVAVRDTVDLPVLVKDFVIDASQIRAAWAAGADAILLIARMVGTETLRHLHEEATALGLAALVECHDEADLQSAVAAGATLIGVNSRNLDTLVLDLKTTRRLLNQKPAGTVMVAESGLKTRSEINEMAELGADAFLIGGTLLTAADPGQTLRHLTGEDQ
jgi:indole-3-glycerol phosphate synthase